MSSRRLDSNLVSSSKKRLMSKTTKHLPQSSDTYRSKSQNFKASKRSSEKDSSPDYSQTDNSNHRKIHSKQPRHERKPEQINSKKKLKVHNEKVESNNNNYQHTPKSKTHSKKKYPKKKPSVVPDSKKSNRKSPANTISSDSEEKRRLRLRRKERSHSRSRSTSKSSRSSSTTSSRSSTSTKSSSSSSSTSSTASYTSVVRLAIGHATTGLPLSERFGRMAQWNSDRKYLDSNLNIIKNFDNEINNDADENITSDLPSPPRFNFDDNPNLMALYPDKLLPNGPNGLGGWDDARVRYQHYKGLGYLRDIAIEDFLKWEEWWYKYQEWLENKKYYESLINRTQRVNRNFDDMKRNFQPRMNNQRRPFNKNPLQHQKELEQLELQIQQRFQQEEEKQRLKDLEKHKQNAQQCSESKNEQSFQKLQQEDGRSNEKLTIKESKT